MNIDVASRPSLRPAKNRVSEMHDFIPDFIVRMHSNNGAAPLNLILETKGYDPLREVKEAAASRWVNAVNADGRFGSWSFRMANSVADVSYILDEAADNPN